MKKNSKEPIVIKFSIMWVFVVVLVTAIMISFCKNVVFAETNSRKTIAVYEPNQKSLDLVNIMTENTDSNNKIINEERELNYTVQIEEDTNLPTGEEQIVQEGKKSKVQITAVQKYENETLIGEEIIDQIVLEEEIPEIKKVGTSEFLKEYQVHIGDTLYAISKTELKEQADDNSKTLIEVSRYGKFTINEMSGDWVKVTYKGEQGYIKIDKVTSEAKTPNIKNINNSLNEIDIDSDLSVPSGLTLEDFKIMLSNNSLDKNKIFENNAEAFYNVEQKYKINGILIAAIGIHESAWGTSKIAMDKKNLFGYTAYDSDPYNTATSFDSYESAIETVAKDISTKYLYSAGTTITEGVVAVGTYHKGKTIKDINMSYASDEQWGEKVISYMQYLYNKL